MNKADVFHHIERKSTLISGISDEIWGFAETAFKEYRSSECLSSALEKEGFFVTKGIGNIKTAFSASFGDGKPVIGILGEYDALSGLSQTADLAIKKPVVEKGNGHGCGHNMLGAGALAACLGAKRFLEQSGMKGTVVYFGCPGEEGGSGKAFMAREGVFDHLDACVTWHPGSHNGVRSGSSLANYQVYYKYHGVSSHAAANPHRGRSALDAVTLLNTGVQFLREHVISDARIHYAVTDTGGFSPNVVQQYAEALYLIRAPETHQVKEIYERINDVAKGAALMTGTHLEIDFVKACSNLVPNSVLEELLYKNMKKAPLPKYTDGEVAYAKSFIKSFEFQEHAMKNLAMRMPNKEDRDYVLSMSGGALNDFVVPYHTHDHISSGSTDVGDVSWVCPTAQITCCSWASETPGHSWQVVAQGKSSIAHKSSLYAGKVMAGTVIDLLMDPPKIAKAKEELEFRLGGRKYTCPIPQGVKPRPISHE